jgi:hypothetical protein
VLTAQQRLEFEELGFVRLRDVFSDDDAARMRRVVWRELERRYGVVEDDRNTWKIQLASGMQTSKKHRAFSAIGGQPLVDAVEALLGDGSWAMPPHWGQVMVTFPDEGAPWRLPGRLWHVDYQYTNAPTPLFGLKLFAFFGDVEAQGGGTLVVSGSHRVVERFVAETPPDARADYRTCRLRFMKQDPWFRTLANADDPDPDRNARFMESDHDADGIAVRVVELTGRPGDVVLTHPWTLHHAAPNAASYPRMMRGKSLHRVDDRPAVEDYLRP